MRYPCGSADEMCDEHLWFGEGWKRPIDPRALEIMQRLLGKGVSPTVEVGNDAIPDELAVLELGPNVEAELSYQEIATFVHGSFGAYLESALVAATNLEDLIDMEETQS